MRSVKFLLLIGLCFTMTQAWADIAPNSPGPYWSHHKGPHFFQEVANSARPQKIGMSMVAAEVKVRIKKIEADAGGGMRIPLFAAHVAADFDMVGTTVRKMGDKIEVFFPVDDAKEKTSLSVPFAVTIDGKPASDVKAGSRTFSDEHGNQVAQWGYAWTVPGLENGQKQSITVRYSFVLPQDESEAHFTYFLRSGAEWDGPIGRETVKVKADKGLRVKVLSPVTLKPVKSFDTSLTWKIINAKPAEDIRLVILPGDKQ